MYKGKNQHGRNTRNEEPQIVTRVRLPRGDEVLGIIEQRLGGSRMSVACLDKITRNCRVPGKLKRKLWLRPGDVVIVKPWEFDKDKGDVIFKYTPTEINFLKTRGILKTEETEF